LYNRELQRRLNAVMAGWLPGALAEIRQHPDVRNDALDMGPLTRRLERELQAGFGSHLLSLFLQQQARKIDTVTSRELAKMLAIDPSTIDGLQVPVFGADWIERNERLTRQIGDDLTRDVKSVFAEFKPGMRGEVLARRLTERFGVSKSAARRIAVNETLTFHGEINKRRQESAGIVSYTWSSSQDGSVRPWHTDLNQTVQSWKGEGPIGGGTGRTDRGHPASGIYCRCIAAALP
jgi:SPP1 gp7 family putative phage head morphogenesis protein